MYIYIYIHIYIYIYQAPNFSIRGKTSLLLAEVARRANVSNGAPPSQEPSSGLRSPPPTLRPPSLHRPPPISDLRSSLLRPPSLLRSLAPSASNLRSSLLRPPANAARRGLTAFADRPAGRAGFGCGQMGSTLMGPLRK